MTKNKHKRLSADEWEKVRSAYVQGVTDADGNRAYPTLEALAESYDVHLLTVHRHSKNEGWREQRAVFEGKLQREMDEEKRKLLSQEAVEFDVNSLRIAKALNVEIVRAIRSGSTERAVYEDDMEAWQIRKLKALEADEDFSEPRPALPRILSTSGLSQLAGALERAQRAGRLALGQSTENQNISAGVDADAGLGEAFQLIRDMATTSKGGGSIIH